MLFRMCTHAHEADTVSLGTDQVITSFFTSVPLEMETSQEPDSRELNTKRLNAASNMKTGKKRNERKMRPN